MLSHLRIGSRRSDLARLQSKLIGASIGSNTFVFREAPGDTNLKDPLWKMPEMGIFTSFLRKYLVTREIDLVVHSWKDLPIEEDAATEIVASPKRADPRDLLLVSKIGLANAYAKGTLTVLSSSPRRKHNLPDFLLKSIPVSASGERIASVQFRDVRGNIQTRLQKMVDGEGDALVVAKAAIDRFLSADQFPEFQPAVDHMRACLSQSLWQVLPLSVNPTAAAQGALAVEMLRGCSEKNILRESVNDESTFACVAEERRILHGLGGGCHQAIGCTVLDRPFGRVTFLRGKASNGEDMVEAKIHGDTGKTCSPEAVIQIGGKGGLQLFDRKFLPVERTITGPVMVAKADAALPVLDFLRAQPVGVWTAGVASWKALAAQGVWVNGSSDGLGESEDKQVDLLMGGQKKWTKLTHSKAVQDPESDVATYELILRKQWDTETLREAIAGKSHFFFASGSAFDVVKNLVPEFVDSVNAGDFVLGCGPGNTYSALSKSVSAPIVVAYNYKEFVKKVVA